MGVQVADAGDELHEEVERLGLAEHLAAIAPPVEQLAQRAVLGVLGQDVQRAVRHVRAGESHDVRARGAEQPKHLHLVQRVRRVAAARRRELLDDDLLAAEQAAVGRAPHEPRGAEAAGADGAYRLELRRGGGVVE